MAHAHGRSAVFMLEDSGTTLRTLSTDLNDISIDVSVNNPENSAFGDTFIVRAASGLADYSLSVSGWYNDASNTIEPVLSGILGDIVLLKYYPRGNVTGARVYAGCVVLDSYSINSPVDGKVTLNAAFSGAAGSLSASTA